jgi:hypothetical protein
VSGEESYPPVVACCQAAACWRPKCVTNKKGKVTNKKGKVTNQKGKVTKERQPGNSKFKECSHKDYARARNDCDSDKIKLKTKDSERQKD